MTLLLLIAGTILGRAPAAFGQSPAAFTWVRTIIPAGTNANGGVFDTAFDSAGNALAAGRVSTNPGGAPQSLFTVVKYDREGAQQWLKQIGGANAGARVVAVDGSDAVIAGGFAGQPTLIKWNAAGALDWSIPPAFSPGAIAIDGNGDIFVGGSLPNFDWAVAKYRGSNGSLAWMRQGNGGVQGTNSVLGLAVDRFNHVAAAGFGQTGGGPFGFLVMRLNGATGVPFWSKYDGGDNDFDQASGVAVNKDGDVIAGGYFTVEGQRFFTVAQYNAASGAREWINQTVGGATPNGWCSAVGAQSSGNVVGFGYVKPPPDSREIEAAAGFNGGTGARLWQSLAPGEAGDKPFAFANAGVVTPDDKLISGGGVGNQQPFNEDFTVWQREANGSLTNTRTLPSNGQGEVLSLATDATGNIAAGGYSVDPAAGDVQFTLAYIETAPPTAVDLIFGQQPTNTFEGAPINPPVTVRIVDSSGATVTTATNAVTLALDNNPGGATLGGTKTVAAVNGIATFSSLTVSKPGNGYTLKATAAGLAGKSATSTAFNVAANTARQLSIAAPSFATVGESFDMRVTALNNSGSKATNYRGTVTLTSSEGATMTPTPYTFTAADAGEHRFKATLTALGAQTLAATDAALPVPSATVNLEGREPMTFVVTTHLDTLSAIDGVTSLREAILAANSKAGKDTITFNIPGAGLHTIRPTTQLPAISDSVTIDGFSQPGASPNNKGISEGINASLMIELSGQDAPAGTEGLILKAAGCLVKGLVINRYRNAPGARNGAAIRVDSPGEASIAGCYLGTDANGTMALPNNIGITLRSASNVVGGESPAARNLISGNGSYGVLDEGAGAANGRFKGNFIGVDASGAKALPNILGIALLTSGNEIGGTSAAARNVISGNTNTGVFFDVGASGNRVLGNFIGTNAAGTLGVLNNFGIFSDAGNQVIGGSGAGQGNLISGNQFGIRFAGDGNVIQGNSLGCNLAGNVSIPNNIAVQLIGKKNLLGGLTAGAGNVIAGNINSVQLAGSEHVVQGNSIGTDRTGNHTLGNGGGVVVTGHGHLIGGTTPAAANRITRSFSDGVAVTGTAANVAIIGNSIYANSQGIDLGADGVTPNDTSDADTGPNALQNYPILSDVALKNGKVILKGSLKSAKGGSYRLDFYASRSVNITSYGEGEVWLGSSTVKQGVKAVNIKASFPVPPNGANLYYCATASRVHGKFLETSEFGPSLRGSFAAVKINFQPALSPLPEGYIFDTGAKFGTHFGYRYGWNDDATADTRDRNSAASPDQRYDTLIHMQKGKKVDWEIEVPNGRYHIKLVAGDPNFFDSVYSIAIEGKEQLYGKPTSAPSWYEIFGPIRVKDGRLTISNGPRAKNNKLCFIEITPLK